MLAVKVEIVQSNTCHMKDECGDLWGAMVVGKSDVDANPDAIWVGNARWEPGSGGPVAKCNV